MHPLREEQLSRFYALGKKTADAGVVTYPNPAGLAA